MSVTHAEFTIERRYPYPPAQTYRAWADPELKRQWFANPGNWADGEWEMDFRVGGGEVNLGGADTGTYREFRSRYHDIVPERRIVFTYDLLHNHRLISVSLTTVEFHPDRNGTRMVFTEQGAFFDDPEAAAAREHGTGKLLDALDRFLAGEPVR